MSQSNRQKDNRYPHKIREFPYIVTLESHYKMLLIPKKEQKANKIYTVGSTSSSCAQILQLFLVSGIDVQKFLYTVLNYFTFMFIVITL